MFQTVTAKRNSLSPVSAESIMVIKDNRERLEDIKFTTEETGGEGHEGGGTRGGGGQ